MSKSGDYFCLFLAGGNWEASWVKTSVKSYRWRWLPTCCFSPKTTCARCLANAQGEPRPTRYRGRRQNEKNKASRSPLLILSASGLQHVLIAFHCAYLASITCSLPSAVHFYPPSYAHFLPLCICGLHHVLIAFHCAFLASITCSCLRLCFGSACALGACGTPECCGRWEARARGGTAGGLLCSSHSVGDYTSACCLQTDPSLPTLGVGTAHAHRPD